PEIIDTSANPKNQIIRMLYLGFDNYEDPNVYSYCYRIELSSLKCIKKKFKIEIPPEDIKKNKLEDIRIKICAQDTLNINSYQIREIKKLLEINDYWLLDKQGSFGDCSFNTWYVETLLDNDYEDFPNYKRLSGTTRGNMMNVIRYILDM
ncbi:MAG: hypothetical protein K2Q22_01840, partial [Cytophagales bacterium]|nr:hypothetical protein [Cytophagales bacterium]